MTAIMKKIKLSRATKRCIYDNLSSGISARLAVGESIDGIQEDMGSPGAAAREIIDNMLPPYSRKLSYLRVIYIVLFIAPFLVCALELLHIYGTPNPGGFGTPAIFIGELIRGSADVIIKLALNLVVYLVICCAGYVLLRYQQELRVRTLVFFLSLCVFALVVQQLLVFGIDTVSLAFGNAVQLESNLGTFLWGMVQPQSILSFVTGCLAAFLLNKKRRAAVPVWHNM